MVTRIGDRRMMTWCCLSHDVTAGKLALCVKMGIITFSTTEMENDACIRRILNLMKVLKKNQIPEPYSGLSKSLAFKLHTIKI